MPLKGINKSLQDFKRHPWLHGLSVLTITISLTILGLFFLSYRNFTYWAYQSSPKTTGTAYLNENLSELEVAQLNESLRALKGVEDTQFKSRQTVLQELGGAYGQKELSGPHLADLFQDIVELRLQSDLSQTELEKLKNTITAMPQILEVDFSAGWFSQLDDVRKTLSWAGLVLMVGLFGGCAFLIANFMGMRHQARKRDLEIMQLLGGSRKFVLLPFFYEALLEGAIGAAASLTLLLLFKIALSETIVSSWLQKLGAQELLFLSPAQIGGMAVVGVLTALLGTLTVFLRFEDR